MGDYETAYNYTGEMTDGTGLVNLRARYREFCVPELVLFERVGYDPGTGRFVSKDKWGGNYNDPITLNKWLYANGNPIIHTDPSGNFSVTDGILIHQMIEAHYLINFTQGNIINVEYGIEGASKKRTGFSGYADIADLTLKQLYEIKPLRSEALGQAELVWYLSFKPGWSRGERYSKNPITIGPLLTNPTQIVIAQLRVPGVISYWTEPQFIPFPIEIPETESNTDQQKKKQLLW